MGRLGEGHFSTPITPLAGETVLWEGGAGKRARLVRGVRVGLVFAVPWLFMLFFCGMFLLVDNVAPRSPSTSVAHDPPPDVSAERSKELAVRHQTVRIVAVTLFGGLSLLLVAGIILEATLACRNAWYMVTNERICIQTEH